MKACSSGESIISIFPTHYIDITIRDFGVLPRRTVGCLRRARNAKFFRAENPTRTATSLICSISFPSEAQMSVSPDPKPILRMRNVSKTFPGVKALQKVELTVYPGEVHALMGENGAGKSTLMKILSGAYVPDRGAEILIDDKPVHINGPLSAKEHGIAIIYQELALAPNLTVAENIYLGREAQRGPTIDRAGMIAGCARHSRPIWARPSDPAPWSGTSRSPSSRWWRLRAPSMRAPAFWSWTSRPPRSSSRETQRLFQVILRLKAEGLAIIYISHRMAEVYELVGARHGAARRRLCRHLEPRGGPPGEHRSHDGRSRSVVLLQEGASRADLPESRCWR